jgi:uncharacterized repeat protein (TIGR02543 family)
MKIHDGTTWQEAKSLKIYNGSAFVSAIKSWVYNGSWQLVYPNSPISTSGPTFSYGGKTYPSPGSVWTPIHMWNMDPAYAATSYSYQWKRNNTPISGATSSTYTATVADIGSAIGVTITATNGRGSTTITGSSETNILPEVETVYGYDSTPTPTQPAVSITPSNLNYSGSWGTSTYATSYTISTTNGSVSPTSAVGSGNFTGSGSAGNVTVKVNTINTNKQVTIIWSAADGASSYDIVKYGNNITTTRNRPSNETSYTWEIADGNESNYFSVIPKTASGAQGYGRQTTASASNKPGPEGSASTTLTAVVIPVPSGGSVSLSPSGIQMADTIIYATATGWSGSPTLYQTQIRKNTGSSPGNADTGPGSLAGTADAYALTTQHQITTGEASGTPDQFAAFARAYNDGGWSPWVKSNTVTSTPYVAPVVSYTVTYNANGGSPNDSINFNSGSNTVAPGVPSKSGHTFNGWYDTSVLDWSYFASAGGTWTPPSRNITMYARWTAVAVAAPGVPSLTFGWISGSGTASSPSTWQASWSDGSGGTPSSWNYELQFSNSNGGAVTASDSGTVYSRSKNYNSYSYAWSRFRVRANGDSQSAFTAWSSWA